jgi:TonB family protein
MRRRATRRIAVLLVMLAPSVAAAADPPPSDPPAQPSQPAQPTQPATGPSIPSGASGAVLTKPKEEEAPAPPPAPVITPPVLKTDEGALYPAQALKDGVAQTVTVTVIVEIDPTGAVRNAAVEAAAGHGFDEAAVEAAKKLAFEPARRNGTPIAVKIKHTYVFAPPASRFSGRIVSADSDSQPIAGAAVTVRGADGVDHAAQTDADGRWSVDGLGAGTYHLTVAAAGMKAQASDEELHAGEEARLTLRLEPEAVAPPPKDDEAPEEVNVRGKRPSREVTRRTLERRELSRIPGTNGDALRALQNLPGVARAPGLAGLLIVRGSAPNDTQIFIDGTLIPIVYHFGGLSSVVPTEILDRIDFYPGNFSAQYGRAMGGIVDVAVREANKKELHGLAQIDLIDARVLAEGPIGNSGWRFAVGGRRSWVDLWLKPVLESTGAGVTTAPVYYDYQALLERDFSSRSSFRVMVLGSDDRLDVLVRNVNSSDPSLGGGISAHTGFWRVQARYKNRFTDSTELRITGAVGQDFADFAVGDNYFKLTTFPISSRIELAQKLGQGVTMNTGFDLLYDPYKVDVRFPPFPKPGEPPSGPVFTRPSLTSSDSDAIYTPAFYTEFEVTPWRGGRIVPGARLDYTKDTKAWDLAPRVVVRQDVTSGFPRTTLKGGAGVFLQPPQPQETNLVFGQPGLKSNRAIHYGLGAEQEITKYLEISVEGFYKQLDRLVTQGAGNVGKGRAFGVETLIRYKPDSRFFGWLAYTLSRSVRQDTPDEPERSAQFDQTHILTVLGSYRLGRGWEVGARYRLVSGNLYTPRAYGFYDENAGAYLSLNEYPRLGSRLPMFHQLDIRVDKTWKFRAWQLAAYLDVQNVYNQGNVEGVSNNFNFTQQTYATGLPILPSLGLRAEF